MNKFLIMQDKCMFKNYEEKNAIELLCVEIKNALQNKMYFSALMMALIIPDVLGKLEYEGNKEHYATWYDEYVKDSMGLTNNIRRLLFNDDNNKPNIFNGTQCYKLRCSLFHSAGTDIGKRTKIKEFVIQISDELFVRGNYANIDYDYKNLKVDEKGRISEDSKTYQLYISANEIATGIVNATEQYIKNNKEKIEKLNKIKINHTGGIAPKILCMGLKDEYN